MIPWWEQADIVQGPLLRPFLSLNTLTPKGSLPPLRGSSPLRAPPLLPEGPPPSLGGNSTFKGALPLGGALPPLRSPSPSKVPPSPPKGHPCH
jgi:hypothetical protein